MFEKFGRIIRAQIRRRLKPDVITIEGLKITTNLGDVTKTIRKALYRETYEAPERRLLKEIVAPGDRVLEVGAGVGLVSLTCARICGAENVLSYEPNPGMRPIIEKNFALNGMTPNLRSKALTTSPGTVDFYFAENIYSSSLYDRGLGEKTPVPCDAISDVFAEFKPNVIVMDIEGAEVDLLPSCDLSAIDKIIVEMHAHVVGAEKVQDLVSYLEGQGFSLKKTLSISYLFAR